MRRALSALIALSLVGFAAEAAAEPQKLWELTGFKTPESVLPDDSGQALFVSNANGGGGDGTIAITNTGAATQTFSGPKITYTGSTILNGGTLQ